MSIRILVAIALATTVVACNEDPTTSGASDTATAIDAAEGDADRVDLGTEDGGEADAEDDADPDPEDTAADSESDAGPADADDDTTSDPDVGEGDADPDVLVDAVEETTPDAPTPDAIEDADSVDGSGTYEPDTVGEVDPELCPPES
jgi:hypothetical protein